MRAPKLQALARWLAVACVLLAPALWPGEASSAASADEWLDTIRTPLRSDDGAARNCPGVGTVAFRPGMAELSVEGKRSVDALAAALGSAGLGKARFTVLWLANDGVPADLTKRRAAAIEADLRSRPALVPERLAVGRAPAAFEDCARSPQSDHVLLQVRIAGRWWGGQ